MEKETFQAMDDHHVFVLSKCRKGEDETDDMDTKMTVKVEKHATDINKEEKKRRYREERASMKIAAFMKKIIFRLKAKNASRLVLMQLKQEKLDEKM